MIEKRIIEKTLKEIDQAESSFQQGINFCYAARKELERLYVPAPRQRKKASLVAEVIKSRDESLKIKIKKV